jgi:hypothetical protein
MVQFIPVVFHQEQDCYRQKELRSGVHPRRKHERGLLRRALRRDS